MTAIALLPLSLYFVVSVLILSGADRAQMAAYLGEQGYTFTVVDVRGLSSILHLKSGISYLGDNTLVLIEQLVDDPLFQGYERIQVAPQESYAANCVRVNDRVLVPAGYPLLTAALEARGLQPLQLEMSEFQKMAAKNLSSKQPKLYGAMYLNL